MDTEFDLVALTIEGRPSRDEFALAVAEQAENRGTCGRAQVGAAIAKDGRILATGYNGPPAGFPHCNSACRDTSTKAGGCVRAVHAEANCLAYAARYGISVEGAAVYCTWSPCLDCAKLIVNSGLSKLVYRKTYRLIGGLELLTSVPGFDIIKL